MKIIQGIAVAWLTLFLLSTLQLANGGEASVPSLYEQPKACTATIYEAGSQPKRVLYRYRRTVTPAGSSLKVVREFNYPDGKIAARETIEYNGNNLVSYDLEELQIGAHGTAKIALPSTSESKGEISFSYVTAANPYSKTNVNTEKLKPDTLVADMMAPFLVSHWDDLMRGKPIKCRFIAATRTETVGFEFVKVSETKMGGKPVVNIKMTPSSIIISALVDPLYFVMEKDGEHRTLQYTGRTTPKIRDGNKWRDLDAETVFDWD